MFRTSVAGVFVALAFGISGFANAATVTQCGPTICYEYDDAQAAVALFGQPDFQGDVVRFLPESFRAQSDDGTGTGTATANFIFSDIYSISGADILQISVVEAGDYQITNGDSVSAVLFMQISNNNDFLEFAADTWSFNASGDSGGEQLWNLSGDLDPVLSFGENDANSMALNIQNTLQAFTNAEGETAWIQKKITLTVATVPVPAAIWLLGSALAFLGFRARRA
jgi:hypothetical protein